MLTGAVILVLEGVVGFATMLLLVRLFMRFMRISFIGQLGQFITATTNWAVMPFQKVLPVAGGRVDLAVLVPAWLIEVLFTACLLMLMGREIDASPQVIATVCMVATLGLVSAAVMLAIGILLISAVLSWVTPYAPIALILNQLTAPILRPIRKLIPAVAGIDLSPLMLLLILQVVQFFLQSLKANLLIRVFV